jgi:DNA-binding protein H-NS
MATLEQIQAKMKKLQAQADVLIAKQSSGVIEKIRELMAKHGLTIADIEAHTGVAKSGARRGPKPGAKRASKSAVGAAKTPVASANGKLAPKYRDPKTGATWSGHARPPAWIRDVKDRSRFLIAGGAETALATSAGTVSKAKTAVRNLSTVAGVVAGIGQRKGPQPAKYVHPKTGASWSGRGPAPAWLAAAKDRTKFLIDATSAVAADAAVASKTKQATKKAAAKKVGAKTVKATKVPTAKKAAAKKAVSATAAAPKSKAPKKVAGGGAAPTVKKMAAKKAPATKAIVAKEEVVAKADVTAAQEGVTAQATA